MSNVEAIRDAVANAIADKLEGRFWKELGDWQARSGFDALGTDAIEAYFLTGIAQSVIRELDEATIAQWVADYRRGPA